MKTDYQQEIITRIRILREKRGVTQLGLSRILGISPGQMGNIDSAKQPHKFTIKQIVSICDFLGVNIEDVLFPGYQDKGTLTVRDVVNAIIKYQDNEIQNQK